MFFHDLPATGPESKAYGIPFIHNLFPLECDIVEKLYGLSIEAFGPNAKTDWHASSYWTHRVQSALSDLGEKEAFAVVPSKEKGTDRFQPPWLCDLVWLEATPTSKEHPFDWRTFRGLNLACICEWGETNTALAQNFLKLTVVVADLRVFVYTNRSIKTEAGLIHPADLCKKACPLSRGFRYLLVGFPTNANGQVRIDAWVA
ncbi:MAG: hypothetical protein KGS09_16170 [Nitrospirae bacterium]|nr:hypothetical protein [Nitrospirota bacterium]MDE3042561.1 hypothetical protein [Nitrospirota bacterium]